MLMHSEFPYHSGLLVKWHTQETTAGSYVMILLPAESTLC